MNWYRSWPAVVPSGRAHVVDNLPRLVMKDFDYSTVIGGWPDDEPGLCLLEWDIALGVDERARFVESALVTPNAPLVAPYHQIYEDNPDGPVCVHRVKRDAQDATLMPRWQWWEPLPEGAEYANLVGFGCIYLPAALVRQFWTVHRGKTPLNDTSFSLWYGRAIRVDWSIHPQHLHGD